MSEQKNKSHGNVSGQIVGRVAKDPMVSQMESSNGGSYELVSALVVCSPYNGKKDPEAIWCMVRFQPSHAEIAKRLKKGDEVILNCSTIRPTSWKGNDDEVRVQLEAFVSRDWNSVHFGRRGNGNGGESGSTEKTQTSSQTSGGVEFDDDDVPF